MSDVLASRNELLSGLKRRYDTMRLPVAGHLVRFQSLSEAEHAAYEMQRLSPNENSILVPDAEQVELVRPRLIALCLVDAEGNRLFGEQDIEQLRLWDSSDTRALYVRLQQHCGMLDGEVREEAKKNSVSGSAATAGSDSTTA